LIDSPLDTRVPPVTETELEVMRIWIKNGAKD
jgi:hypothetical protein